MVKRFLIYFFTSLLFGGLFFYLTNNIIMTIVIFAAYLLYFLVIFEKKFRFYSLIISKTKECISFINSFIITISINKSITTTFNSLSSSFSDSLVEQVNSINQLNDEEKVMYLDNYFENHLYTAFTKILKQFVYEGGNILDSSDQLIFDSRIVEENLENYLSISRAKVFQFYVMWSICFVIMIIMHLFLGEYYTKICAMEYFPYSVACLFLIFLICQALIFNCFFNLSFVNKEIKNEKNKKQN